MTAGVDEDGAGREKSLVPNFEDNATSLIGLLFSLVTLD
jgi:hypothetical protein